VVAFGIVSFFVVSGPHKTHPLLAPVAGCAGVWVLFAAFGYTRQGSLQNKGRKILAEKVGYTGDFENVPIASIPLYDRWLKAVSARQEKPDA
jgi:hypothetical protein